MTQVEFERLVGREVTSEQYKLIEELYMQSSLSKQDFAKQMKKVVNSLPRPRCSKTYTMAVTDKSGHYRTPNGCYIHTVQVELLDVSVRTGSLKVKVVPNSYEMKYSADFYDNDRRVSVVR